MNRARPSYPEIQRRSPTRAPAWRWELATWLVTTGRAVPDRYRDAWVDRAHRHLTARRGSRRDAAVQEAVDLFSDAPRLRRALVEAYLLTGEPLAVAAARCGVSVPTAEAYANLFFDVNLKARDKVAVMVIGPGLGAGVGVNDVGRIWKAAGYHTGLVTLDAVVAVCIEDGLVDGGGPIFPAPHRPSSTSGCGRACGSPSAP